MSFDTFEVDGNGVNVVVYDNANRPVSDIMEYITITDSDTVDGKQQSVNVYYEHLPRLIEHLQKAYDNRPIFKE